MSTTHHERTHTVVIGGGQAGLSVGYFLKRQGRPFVILDAHARIGDSWRHRWDSLRLFTPAKFDGLAGMPFPAPPNSFPTKDQMGDYLETYARQFELPVRSGVRVTRLSRTNGRFLIESPEGTVDADNVVVAMASYQRPRVPSFATELAPDIVQFHSADYRSPSQLQPGGVLLVGGGNSGSEIALEVARTHRTWMAGRDTGHIPFRIDSVAGQTLLVRLVLRVLFHRILTVRTPVGRKARPSFVSKGGPLIRIKPSDLTAASVERVPRVAGVRDGKPALADGRVLEVRNVIWSTGFDPGFAWIDLPIFEPGGEPRHRSGAVPDQPGLFFVGLHFLHAVSSTMVHGVGRDAERIAGAIARRAQHGPD